MINDHHLACRFDERIDVAQGHSLAVGGINRKHTLSPSQLMPIASVAIKIKI
jgi:hypothetical protein